ncbi:MAG TPA: hypothetical protein VFE14_16765 [Micromonosporaceae bacterium]|jgi:hypothetical protein|nr:hypothetical protein [Micromonosporaceae bacterium]
MPRQLSLFGVEAADPTPADLAGLLAGPGELVRMGGTARISVPVADAWRVHALIAELAIRGLPASWESTVDKHFAVRTAYTSVLMPLAAAWLRGTGKLPPPGFALDGRRLRLWLVAAGGPEVTAGRAPGGFVLRLGAADEPSWAPAGAALAALGLAGALLSPGAGGPAYRIEGRRRLARLAELVGDPPAPAPAGSWPV